MDTNALNVNYQTSIRAFFQPCRQPRIQSPGSASDSVSSSTSGLRQKDTCSLSQGVTPTCLKKPEILQYGPIPSQFPSGLPSQAAISTITHSQIQPLRRINDILLPVSYPDSFYNKILSPDPPISFSHVITWSDPECKVIGGIVCRLDLATSCPDNGTERSLMKNIEGNNSIYIQTLVLLSPYRGKGLATEALRAVIRLATEHQELKIGSLHAHVWTENKEALEWYTARGFNREGNLIQGYYRRLKPDTAWMLRRQLTTKDYLANFDSPSFSKESSTTKIKTNPSKIGSALSTRVPKPFSSIRSFQEKGPDREWNDLPKEILSDSPRNSDTKILIKESLSHNEAPEEVGPGCRRRKKRVYPAAAFGS
ncbi:Pre-mRNA-splicing factor cwf24 [Golovinomyces cichoracearum]|uniref:Pre-mRNA-splicing factor cwf24 n=1 Tax=Golovinomyces cichoracearum TaxID=62708 RepID=A0A420HIW9_9PEZI|nr:Pre-mRNA-splicing factor cwf24 [Golovinomyces cichoracearum]